MSELSALLGFDTTTAQARLARSMVQGDRRLVDKLIELRRRKNLTQEDLAERMGVSQSAVAKFENGPRDPRLSTLRRYALALGVQISHQVRGEDCSAVDDLRRRGDHVIREIQGYLETRPGSSTSEWDPRNSHHLRISTPSGVVTLPLSEEGVFAVGERRKVLRTAKY